MPESLINLARATSASSNETLKALPKQLYEMVRLRAGRGIGPRYYLKSGLNRTGVRTADVLDHINEGEYRRFIRSVNPPARRNALNSKIEQKRLLVAAGIPTPQPIYSAEPGRAEARGLEEVLQGFDGQRIAVKPVSSFGGDGFRSFRVKVAGGEVGLVDGDDRLSPAELAAAMTGGMLVEPYLEQHPWYAGVNASSVNTWRIWVIKPPGGGSSETVLAYLRMGRAGSAVDNMGAGGLFAPLHANGTLGAAEDGSVFRHRFAVHPDSGQRLEGAKPPLTFEAKALAQRALDAIPALGFAGMDIAVGTDGPVVIEVNPEPDRMGAARVGLPFKRWLVQRGYRH